MERGIIMMEDRTETQEEILELTHQEIKRLREYALQEFEYLSTHPLIMYDVDEVYDECLFEIADQLDIKVDTFAEEYGGRNPDQLERYIRNNVHDAIVAGVTIARDSDQAYHSDLDVVRVNYLTPTNMELDVNDPNRLIDYAHHDSLLVEVEHNLQTRDYKYLTDRISNLKEAFHSDTILESKMEELLEEPRETAGIVYTELSIGDEQRSIVRKEVSQRLNQFMEKFVEEAKYDRY